MASALEVSRAWLRELRLVTCAVAVGALLVILIAHIARASAALARDTLRLRLGSRAQEKYGGAARADGPFYGEHQAPASDISQRPPQLDRLT